MVNVAKLKIGFVFDDTLDSYDGVSQYVKTLGAWLSSQGYEIRYLVGQTKMHEWTGGRVFSMSKNIKVSFNGNRATIPLPAAKKNIRKVLADENFDVLHVQMPHSPFMAQRVVNAAGPKTIIVGTFHVAPGSIFSSWGGHLLRLGYGRGLKRFDQILSVSSAAARYATSAFGLRTEILPNVIDLEHFAKDAGAKKSHDILFFGRLVKRKGAQELIEAFNILHRSNKDLKLTIAGDGPQRENLERLVDGFGLGEYVNFLGFISEADKPKLLASVNVACFPSTRGESFGIVLLEAMAAGAKIVIAGNNPGYSTVLGDQPELLFDPNNAKTFAQKLDDMLQHNKQTQDLHNWQQQEVKKYDVEVVGRKLLKIYDDIIAKHTLKRHN